MLRALLILATVGLAFGRVILDEGDGNKIVGGRNITIEEVPWQVSLERKDEGNRHFCGGSIVGHFTILTAAHCLERGQESIIRVHYGSTIRSDGGYVRDVKRIIRHLDYNNETSDNDIALLILYVPIVYGPTVQPIELPSFNYDLETGEPLLITGWGVLEEDAEEVPDVLQSVELNIFDQELCAQKYEALPKYPNITDRMFCAGTENVGGVDSCQGDSGGPVVHRSELGTVLYGVVSWGYGCGRPSHPGVYTRVSRFLQWFDYYSYKKLNVFRN